MKLPPGYVPGSGHQKATAYGGFGEKLMKHMGWEDGQGLGRDKQGMRKVIEVKVKVDTVGVGGKSTYAWEKKWWEDAFNVKATGIQDVDSGSSDSSDDELSLPGNRDGTRSSAHAHELRIAATLAKDPWGRFGGRDGKMARIKAQEAAALAALQARAQSGASAGTSASSSTGILCSAAGSKEQRETTKKQGRQGASSAAAAAGVSVQDLEGMPGLANGLGGAGARQQRKAKRKKALQPPAPGSGAGGAAGAPEAPPEASAGKKRRKARAATAAAVAAAVTSGDPAGQAAGAVGEPEQAAAQCVVHEVAVQPAGAAAEAFAPTARSGWWGAGRFRSAGCLEGLEHTAEHVARQRQSFTEGTQEGLYTAAQAAKTANKKGLGSASALKKVAGARWKGVRTVIEEPDQEAAPSSPPPKGAAEEGLSLGSIKWRKLATGMLQQAPEGGIALKKLSLRLVKAAAKGKGQSLGKAARTAWQQEVMRKVSNSSRFNVEGDMVRLKS